MGEHARDDYNTIMGKINDVHNKEEWLRSTYHKTFRQWRIYSKNFTYVDKSIFDTWLEKTNPEQHAVYELWRSTNELGGV